MPLITYKELDFLKKEIEIKLKVQNEKINYKIKKIQQSDKIKIETAQLNRIWRDYTTEKDPNGTHNIQEVTINSLVNILERGYTDWVEYRDYLDSIVLDESLFDPDLIDVDNLKIGELLILGWLPQYYLKVEYKGDYCFEIKECVGDFKKKVGDTFKAKKFILLYSYCYGKESVGYRLHPTICATMNENATSDTNIEEFL